MNQLKVNQKQTIVTLRSQGWSVRRISRELGYDRETVSKYVRLEEAKPATPSPGSDPDVGASGLAVPGVPDNRPLGATPLTTKVSLCEKWRKEITAGWEQGCCCQRPQAKGDGAAMGQGLPWSSMAT